MVPDTDERLARLERQVGELRHDLAVLRRLEDIDAHSALNKIRRITEKVLLGLCDEHNVSWGKGEAMLGNMAGPLKAHGIVPKEIALELDIIQRLTSAGSHHGLDLGPKHVKKAQDALFDFLEWYCKADVGARDLAATPKRRPALAIAVAATGFVVVGVAVWAVSEGARTGATESVTSRDGAEHVTAPPTGMVFVEAGTFVMGTRDLAEPMNECTAFYADANGCEQMLARETRGVDLMPVRAFLLDRTEVTNAAFAHWLAAEIGAGRAVARDGSVSGVHGEPWWTSNTEGYAGLIQDGDAIAVRRDGGYADLPVTGVSWVAADAYCRSKDKRLPTEVEWEYAARGSTSAEFVWGQRPPCETVAVERRPPGKCSELPERPRAVASSPVDTSWCGVFDLGANVAEWVADPYVDESGCVATESTPREGERHCRAKKGGSFADPFVFARPAAVSRAGIHELKAHVGFRCARTSEENAG